MRLLRKLTNKEWKEIGEKYKDGGVYMYRGKKTLFCNEEILLRLAEEQVGDNLDERHTWEVIIVLPGVEIIPQETFNNCENVKTVIMANTVKRIEDQTFCWCESLKFVRLSKSLEYIGEFAFYCCSSLPSIYIPPSCREIGRYAFIYCIKFVIFTLPHHTHLGADVIKETALISASPCNRTSDHERINEWIKTINDGQDFNLHRECASMSPSSERIYEIIKAQGLQAFNRKNSIGITALEYLSANPYADLEINQQAIARKYILEMMGEVV